MQHFVTGASGFIGKRLVRQLLSRPDASVHFLIREPSLPKVDDTYECWGVGKAHAMPITGGLREPRLGAGKAVQRRLKGKIDHVFHVAAIHDLMAGEEEQVRANIGGTRNAVELAAAQGRREGAPAAPTADPVALGQMMRGIHF